MSFWSEPNEVYAAERDESRSALRGMTEAERVASCRHDGGIGSNGVCAWCGERPDL